ncbi:hypothetical protein TVAG_157390 [Trichomonas vaginalis G3]|uniref:Uncharacterized protein n=1 Tax=Trichomonas vaginalis (strain ATCC PRA-98 / G3) TaxID=412133 RepID=A2E9L1_TRIV3|nr:hypothetical protein TVAGG3_0746370 [Trichomonas vaginalis G3]EAY10662.1 hypothetical protein TVAG_157390 [Trichomonas vaginalis G3]KAI5512196.1 hypothetical protein TVAGG3_0746370 [Trichomonas vaginalis G3]|eukprot:XP_001322885.1 hypothetical protein [Trichomonas vaginalis G3]
MRNYLVIMNSNEFKETMTINTGELPLLLEPKGNATEVFYFFDAFPKPAHVEFIIGNCPFSLTPVSKFANVFNYYIVLLPTVNDLSYHLEPEIKLGAFTYGPSWAQSDMYPIGQVMDLPVSASEYSVIKFEGNGDKTPKLNIGHVIVKSGIPGVTIFQYGCHTDLDPITKVKYFDQTVDGAVYPAGPDVLETLQWGINDVVFPYKFEDEVYNWIHIQYRLPQYSVLVTMKTNKDEPFNGTYWYSNPPDSGAGTIHKENVAFFTNVANNHIDLFSNRNQIARFVLFNISQIGPIDNYEIILSYKTYSTTFDFNKSYVVFVPNPSQINFGFLTNRYKYEIHGADGETTTDTSKPYYLYLTKDKKYESQNAYFHPAVEVDNNALYDVAKSTSQNPTDPVVLMGLHREWPPLLTNKQIFIIAACAAGVLFIVIIICACCCCKKKKGKGKHSSSSGDKV